MNISTIDFQALGSLWNSYINGTFKPGANKTDVSRQQHFLRLLAKDFDADFDDFSKVLRPILINLGYGIN